MQPLYLYLRSKVLDSLPRRRILMVALLLGYASPVLAGAIATLDPWPRSANAALCQQPYWTGDLPGGYSLTQRLEWIGSGSGCSSPYVGSGHFNFLQYSSLSIYFQQHANDRTWECGTPKWNSNPQVSWDYGLTTSSVYENYGTSCNLQADTNMEWWTGSYGVWHYQYY